MKEKSNKKKSTRRGNGEGSIYERKPGQWAAVISNGVDPATGKARRKFVYGKSRGEVKDKLREIQNQQATGTIPDAGKLTLGEWLNIWLENYAHPGIRQSTYDSYKQQIEKHINPAMGKKLLKKVTTTDIQCFYRAMLDGGNLAKVKDQETGDMVMKGGGLSAATLVRIHNILKPALEQAKIEHKIAFNPAAATKPPKAEKKEMEVLEQDEVGTFLQASKGYRYYPAYVFALSSGVRRGEVLGLPWPLIDTGVSNWTTLDKIIPWDAVDALPLWDTDALFTLLEPLAEQLPFMALGAALVHIKQQLNLTSVGMQLEEPKTALSKRDIEIPLDTVLVLIFQRGLQRKEKAKYEKDNPGVRYNPDDLVFCTSHGTPVPPRGFTRNFQNALTSAGVKKVRFHDLRHTVATVLLEEGAALNTVSELLGHYDPAFTATQYGHVTKRMRSEATGKLGDMLKSAKKRH